MSRFERSMVLVGVLCLGCGGDEITAPPADGVTVTGEVKWKNARLVWGIVQFSKVDAPTEGASADIVDGKYTVDPVRRLKPGKYRVQLFGGTRREDDPQVTGPVTDNEPNPYVLPPQHNEKSKITVEVTSASSQTLNFNLP
jgi:hypothetical protein